MYKKDRTLLVGIVTFVCVIIILSFLLGPTTCHDGWRSSSIGSRGACSSHGGVDQTKGFIKLLLSFGISFGAASFYSSQRKNYENKNQKHAERVDNNHSDTAIDSQPRLEVKIDSVNKETKISKVKCPVCGGPMKLRKAKKGRNARNIFWGCRYFPKCRGTRNYISSK